MNDGNWSCFTLTSPQYMNWIKSFSTVALTSFMNTVKKFDLLVFFFDLERNFITTYRMHAGWPAFEWTFYGNMASILIRRDGELWEVVLRRRVSHRRDHRGIAIHGNLRTGSCWNCSNTMRIVLRPPFLVEDARRLFGFKCGGFGASVEKINEMYVDLVFCEFGLGISARTQLNGDSTEKYDKAWLGMFGVRVCCNNKKKHEK